MTYNEQFKIKFGGNLVDSGLMDVRELAPALLSLGNLLQETNNVLNGDRAQVSVQVRSQIKRGSFEVDFVLTQGILEQAQEFLKIHPAITDAKGLLEIIFFYGGIASTTGYGLIRFLRWLRGRQIPKGGVSFINNGIVQIVIDNESVEISQNTYNLATNDSVRKAVEGVVAPLHRDGIDYVEFSKDDENREMITKEELASFQAGEIGRDLLIDDEREAVLSIVRLSFKPGYKWAFTDGAVMITAAIDDPHFWERIHSGHKFAEGDQLLVTIRTKTHRVPSGELKSEYSIPRVIEYIPKRYPNQIRF